MPNCFLHDGVSISWEIGTKCPLCEAHHSREDLSEKLRSTTEEALELQEVLQDLQDSAASVAAPKKDTPRRRFQAPRSAGVYEDYEDYNDEF